MDNLIPTIQDSEKWKRLVAEQAKKSLEPSKEVSIVAHTKYKKVNKKTPSHKSPPQRTNNIKNGKINKKKKGKQKRPTKKKQKTTKRRRR